MKMIIILIIMVLASATIVAASIADSTRYMEADKLWGVLDFEGKNITGEGVRVAIIDEGFDYTHPDFGNCTLDQIYDGNCTKIAYGYDYINNVENITIASHGTRVAGILGANGQLKGVAPNCTFLLYMANSGFSINESIYDAIDKNASVISISQGRAISPDDSLWDISAVKYATENGALVIAGVSNSQYEYTIFSPAAVEEAIAVTTYIQTSNFQNNGKGYPYYSNGSIIDVKPNVMSPAFNANTTDVGGGYIIPGGTTSFATPHVAGLAALLKQAYPDMDSQMLKSLIVNWANPTGIYKNRREGSGVINALDSYNATAIVLDSETFISLTEEGNNTDRIFNITSIVNESITYTFGIVMNESDINLDVTINTSELTLPAKQSYLFRLIVNGTGSTVSGIHDGNIQINTSRNTNITIPFSVLAINNPTGCPNKQNVSGTLTMLNDISCYVLNVDKAFGFFYMMNDSVLDCNGSVFVSERASSTDIIKIDGKNNITIKNCKLSNGFSLVEIDESSDILIYNNTINTSVNPINIQDSDNVTINFTIFDNNFGGASVEDADITLEDVGANINIYNSNSSNNFILYNVDNTNVFFSDFNKINLINGILDLYKTLYGVVTYQGDSYLLNNYQLNVTTKDNVSSSALGNVNLDFNNNSVLVETSVTDSNGLLSDYFLAQYKENGDGRTYFNWTIQADKSGYNDLNYFLGNLTEDSAVELSLQPISFFNKFSIKDFKLVIKNRKLTIK